MPITSSSGQVRRNPRICFSSKQQLNLGNSVGEHSLVWRLSLNLAKGRFYLFYRDLKLKCIITISICLFSPSRFELTPEEAGFGLTHFNLRDTILSDTCPSDPTCDQKTIRSPFRMLDGSCNNIKRPSWGRSRTQFQRALVPAYADGNTCLNATNM